MEYTKELLYKGVMHEINGQEIIARKNYGTVINVEGDKVTYKGVVSGREASFCSSNLDNQNFNINDEIELCYLINDKIQRYRVISARNKTQEFDTHRKFNVGGPINATMYYMGVEDEKNVHCLNKVVTWGFFTLLAFAIASGSLDSEAIITFPLVGISFFMLCKSIAKPFKLGSLNNSLEQLAKDLLNIEPVDA